MLIIAPPVIADTAHDRNIDGVLLDEVGPGWLSVECPQVAPEAGATACFARKEGSKTRDFLIVSVTPLPAGIDPRAVVEGSGSNGESFQTPGLYLAAGEVIQLDGRVSVTVAMAASDYIFHLVLDSSASRGNAEALLLDVAQRQQANVGKPVEGPDTQRTAGDLDGLLLTPPDGSGLEIVSTIDAPIDLSDLRSKARTPAVVDLLADAPARVRFFSLEGVPVLSVSLWEQPYEVFAAAALGTFAERPPDPSLNVDLDSLPHAVVFRLPLGTYDGLAIALRKGRYLAFLVALSDVSDKGALARTLVELAKRQADLLPPGETTPYLFPSTARSIAVTAALTTAICGGTVGIGPLAARRRRRSTRARAGGGVPTIEAHDVIDVTKRGVTLRRRGLLLAVVDVAAVNTIVAGSLAASGVLRLPVLLTVTLLATGVLGGILFTAWWARSELRWHRDGDVLARELRPSMLGLIGGILALALLVLGLAAVAAGLAGVSFGPSLSGLQRSQRLGVDPRLLNLGALVVGLVLLAVGGFAVRLARIWARASATRLRALDQRAPILYLRSFEDDGLRLPVVVSARRPFLELFAARGSDLFEESIAWQVAPYGPVVAIGRPGRSLRSLGAAREHLSDDVWQPGVAERMASARAIVVILGATEGLKWEFAQLVTDGHLSKTVFLFPPVAEELLRSRWRFTFEVLVSSGAEIPGLPVAAESTLAAVLDRRGVWRVAVAEVRDESTYRASLDQAMDWLAHTQESASASVAPTKVEVRRGSISRG